jgi:hypothetical protein
MPQPIMRFKEHLKEFDSESDRALVVLAAAMLEELLGELLRARLVPHAGNNDPLFDGVNAPFSSFSASIDGCFRTGLISSQLARDLHLLRKIRNDFAHGVTSANFSIPAVLSRVSELSRSHGLFERSPNWSRTFGTMTPRKNFVSTVVAMITALEAAISITNSISDSPREWFYTESFDDIDKKEQNT